MSRNRRIALSFVRSARRLLAGRHDLGGWYNLTADESRQLSAHPLKKQILESLESWREDNGSPDRSSPLVRGMLLDMLRGEASAVATVVVYGVEPYATKRFAKAKYMDARRLLRNQAWRDALTEGLLALRYSVGILDPIYQKFADYSKNVR